MMNINNKRKGFTVVELVIVIAIIAIISTLLITTFGGIIKNARESADKEEIAALNKHLAMTDISSESDLYDALEGFYGKAKLADFAPKSAQYGLHYWYDVSTNRVILSSYDDLAGSTSLSYRDAIKLAGGSSVSGSTPFENTSLRKLEIGGKVYIFLDKSGSEIADLLAKVDAIDSVDVYTGMMDSFSESSEELGKAIYENLKTIAIVNNLGMFAYDQDPEAIYVPNGTTILGSATYVDGDPVDRNQVDLTNITKIELPDSIEKVSAHSMTGFYNGELYINISEHQFEDFFEAYSTDCVIVLPNGAKYVVAGAEIYKYPRSEGDAPVASGLGASSISDIEITFSDNNSNLGADGAYFYNDTLYLACDIGSVQLSLANGLSAGMVNWNVSDGAPIEINNSGAITIKGGFDVLNTSATVTASLDGVAGKNDTINVQVVYPTSVSWKLGSITNSAPATNSKIDLTYTDTTEFHLVLDSVGYSQNSYVKMVNEMSIKFETSGELFRVVDNKLVLDPSKLSDTSTQTLTVKYGTDDCAYISQDYEVCVVDNTATSFEVKKITDDVKMGASYLFRVGNGNSFAVGKLFTTSKAPDNITLTIYDASKTSGTATRAPIATSGNGFKATYTSNLTKDNWESSTIQFSGTGVAIIEIKTDKGTATLAVEVVNGKNVTVAGDFTGATNYVLLNNIDWDSTKDVAISGTIYGNGFAINASSYKPAVSGNTAMFKLNGGTIDNLVINGPVYPSVSYSGEQYYISGIYALGDAKITNSMISGFRQPIMANGTSLYLENTTLVGGNYGNLWLQTGILTLKDVTTVQISGRDVVGLGIVAGGTSNITIIGKLNQYNWVTESDAQKMDSNVKEVVTQIFKNGKLVHSVNNNAKYVNQGILFLGTAGTVNNANQTNKTYYEMESVTVKIMGQSIEGTVYTYTNTNGAISSVPTYDGYTPKTQAILKPEFKHNLTLTNGEINLKLVNGSATLNASGYTVSKYTNLPITVNVTCTGGTIANNIITFDQAGTYTLTYTVEDNTFFDNEGKTAGGNIVDRYTVKVVVSKAEHKSAEIDLSGLTYKAGWSVSNLNGGDGRTDYSGCYAVLDGLKVYDYDEDGNKYQVAITIDDLKGLTITASDSEVDYVIKENGVYWLVDNKADNNKANKSTTFTYSFTGSNGQTVSKKSDAFSLPSDDTRQGPNCVIGSSGGSETCVTPDTMITLADGTQVRVDSLTGNELLLVWNMETGNLDYAPIMFVDSDPKGAYEIIKLYFSDGTDVKIIGEHGFWDYDLNKYVYLDENATQYVGHWFAKQNGDTLEKVQLVDVTIETGMTEAWSPVTQGHLCYFVNGMLSMPGGVGGLFNILDVDSVTMTYDYEALARDIEIYGLFTYEEMNAIIPLSEDMFNMAGGAYLKISIGKGNMTMNDLIYMIERYSVYFN